MIAAWAYEEGFRSIEGELVGIRRRIARGRERVGDRDDLAACELALAELRALYRADRRIELELLVDGIASPLDVALIQCEELIADGLPIRHLEPNMREALRRDREADFARVLYGSLAPEVNSATT